MPEVALAELPPTLPHRERRANARRTAASSDAHARSPSECRLPSRAHGVQLHLARSVRQRARRAHHVASPPPPSTIWPLRCRPPAPLCLLVFPPLVRRRSSSVPSSRVLVLAPSFFHRSSSFHRPSSFALRPSFARPPLLVLRRPSPPTFQRSSSFPPLSCPSSASFLRRLPPYAAVFSRRTTWAPWR